MSFDGLVAALGEARHVVVLTGAGISAESGVPTFRDALTGLWANHRPEDLATPEAFDRDPQFVWSWYEWRRDLVGKAEPNAGHLALVALAEAVPRMTLITQNVDGLHQRAGSRGVIEFHGNLYLNRCRADGRTVDGISRPCPALPKCPECGAAVRPGVVWFGEAIPEAALTAAGDAVTDCDLFVSVGTSALVYPAAGLAELALARGAILAEVNPMPTGLAAAARFVLAEASGKALPRLVAALRPC